MRVAKRRIACRVGFEICLMPWKHLIYEPHSLIEVWRHWVSYVIWLMSYGIVYRKEWNKYNCLVQIHQHIIIKMGKCILEAKNAENLLSCLLSRLFTTSNTLVCIINKLTHHCACSTEVIVSWYIWYMLIIYDVICGIYMY